MTGLFLIKTLCLWAALGNLIALPLQKAARSNNNSVFIDEKFEPFKDQWEFMTTLRKLSKMTSKVLYQNFALEMNLEF